MFFSIEPQICDCERAKCAGDLPYKWTYKNGVFPGHFEDVLGKGGEGVVIQGEWHGKHAAFKFSPVKHTDPIRKVPEKIKARVEQAIRQGMPFDQAIKTFYSDSYKNSIMPENTQGHAQEYLMKDLNEIFKMQATIGSAILKPYGHFRFVCNSLVVICRSQIEL